MSEAMKDFDWFASRIEAAKWESESPGSRSFLGWCPVHGGSDSLHVTEKNSKAVIHCFSCKADYRAVVTALEEGAAQEPEEEAYTVPTVIRRRVTAAEVTADDEPAPARVSDPLAWYAQYCGVDEAWLRTLPVAATADGWVSHQWDATVATKDRLPNSRNRRWVPKGANGPRLWPQVPDTLPKEIWITEGETDAIVLRSIGLEAYSAGSATQTLTSEEMEGLKTRGVRTIIVAYDNDKEGRRATKETLEAARECGIGVSVASLGDSLLGGPKDWRERHVNGDDSIPQHSASAEAASVFSLDEVAPATATKLLLDRIHPSEHTILFGDGGTGKGVIAAWWTAKLTLPPHSMNVLVLDYEAHASHEWRPRVEAFGGDLTKVFITQPTIAIWDLTGAINKMVDDHAIDIVVVDSVTYSCLGLEVEKSSTAAQYSVALAQVHRPFLSLAHVTKTDLDPSHPFGSIFWSNGARITWSVHYDHDDMTSPRVLNNRKTNQAAPSKPVEIAWEWVEEGLPDTLEEREAKGDVKGVSLAILQILDNGDRTGAQLEKDLAALGLPGSHGLVTKSCTELLNQGKILRTGGPRSPLTLMRGTPQQILATKVTRTKKGTP